MSDFHKNLFHNPSRPRRRLPGPEPRSTDEALIKNTARRCDAGFGARKPRPEGFGLQAAICGVIVPRHIFIPILLVALPCSCPLGGQTRLSLCFEIDSRNWRAYGGRDSLPEIPPLVQLK